MSAYERICEYLQDDETPEAIVFGKWQSCSDDLKCIPYNVIGKIIKIKSLDVVKKYLVKWDIVDEYGANDVYSFYLWTNKRVIFIVVYDGATWLESVPRNPEDVLPKIFGGY